MAYGGKCYEFRTERASWSGAHAICGDLGSRLAPADNPGLNDFLQKMTKVHGATSWFGVFQPPRYRGYVTRTCPIGPAGYTYEVEDLVSSMYWKDPQSIKVSQSRLFRILVCLELSFVDANSMCICCKVICFYQQPPGGIYDEWCVGLTEDGWTQEKDCNTLRPFICEKCGKLARY